MSNKLKNKEKGFTIIEVMIVLAIAGLIMLIVFLAVPALQRNSRNTARRNDAARIASAANSFEANNNGSLPGQTTNAATDASSILSEAGTLSQYTGLSGAGANPAGACVAGSLTANNLTVCKGANITLTAPATDGLVLAIQAQCGVNGAITVGSGKQMALVYTLEGGSGTVLSCLNI